MDQTLSQAVEVFAQATQALSDDDLSRDWTWHDHEEGVRFAHLGTYHELRDLAVTLAAGRANSGRALTAAQHALGQYHAAYCDLQAVVVGVGDDELDRPPAEAEWPLRRVLKHIIGADRAFYTLVHHAIAWHRAGEQPRTLEMEDLEALVGPEALFEETIAGQGLAGILDYYAAMHGRFLEELAGVNDQELAAPSLFWEPEAKPVAYRLHRFDAHLRQHTVQAEKTLAAVGHKTTESRRLLRLVYSALAEAEGALIGAWDFGFEQRRQAATTIGARAGQIAALFGSQ